MAENKVTYQNFVNVVGYMKDNTLETFVTTTKKEAIRGQITIALDSEHEHRMKFLASKTYNDGRENPLYSALLALMPDKCVTIKTLLELNEHATFDEVKLQATKVWVNGEFDLYDRKMESGDISSLVTLNGRNAGSYNANSKKPFVEKAIFKVEGYVNAIKDEKKDDTETGRLIVEMLLPDTFNETVRPVTFIVPADIASVVADNWHRGDTVFAEGTLVNVRQETAPTRQARTSLLGNKEEVAPTYTFVNERVIKEPFPAFTDSDAKFISADTIRTYTTNRDKMLNELEVTAEKSHTNDGRAPLATSGASDVKKGFVL